MPSNNIIQATSATSVRVTNAQGVTFQFSPSSATTYQSSSGWGESFIVVQQNSNITISYSGNPTFLGRWDHGAAGIQCDQSSITFSRSQGTGTLTATGGDYAAGIGPMQEKSCKVLQFLSGDYVISGGRKGAAIGSAQATGNVLSRVDSIIIRGGTFRLTANESASAIGTGYSWGGWSRVGEIEIFNGTFAITRPGDPGQYGVGAAAIGTGGADNDTQSNVLGQTEVDRITIHGGTFNMQTREGSIIGAGLGSNKAETKVNAIRILGGTFNGTTTQGSGIGAGRSWMGNSTVGSIVIENGTFTFRVDNGAGIGGGAAQIDSGNVGATASSAADSIDIRSGTFRITTGAGAAIGAGQVFSDGSTASVGSVVIHDGNFTLQTQLGAGIGAGFSMDTTKSTVNVGSVDIRGGSFKISSGDGAAIGGGFASLGSATVGRVDIASGTFDLCVSGNGTGIGSGSGNTSVGKVNITGGRFSISSAKGAGIGTSFFEGGGAEGAAGLSVALSGCEIVVGSADICIGWAARPATTQTQVPSVAFGRDAVVLECHPNAVNWGGQTGSERSGIRAPTLSFGSTSSLHATMFGSGARLFSRLNTPLTSLGTATRLFVQYDQIAQNTELDSVDGLAVGNVTFPEKLLCKVSFNRIQPNPAVGYRIADFDARRCKAFVAHLPVEGTYQVKFRVNDTYCPTGRLYQPNDEQETFGVAGGSFVAQAIGTCAELSTRSFSQMSRFPYRRNSLIMQIVLYSTFIAL
jgi:hypothetical protein